jgi:O-antigen/teichoic acid export membrane protein
MMLSALLGFMAFTDLGIGNGVLNQVTKAKALDNQVLLRQTLVGGYFITSFVGCLLVFLWFAWTKLSIEPTMLAGAISDENRSEVMKALTLFVFILAINVPASLIQRVQLGFQQGYLNGFNQLVYAILTLILVPLTLYWGGGVGELVLATLGVQAMVNVLNSLLWLHKHGMLSRRIWFNSFDTKTSKLLIQSGSMFFLLQLATAFAFQSDAIVITQVIGQSAYGEFAVIQKLFLFISMLLSAAMLGLWPAFGEAYANNEKAWIKKTFKRGIVTAAVVTSLGVCTLSAMMPWILEFWMKSSIQLVWSLIIALAIWTVIDGMANVAAAFMNGANLLRSQLLLAVGMASAAFAAKWLLTPVFGATGAVIATICAYCIISVPGQIYILQRAFNTKE